MKADPLMKRDHKVFVEVVGNRRSLECACHCGPDNTHTFVCTHPHTHSCSICDVNNSMSKTIGTNTNSSTKSIVDTDTNAAIQKYC